MSDGAGYQAISYACVAAFGAASAAFTHFLSLCEALKNKPLCRLVFFFPLPLSGPSACRLWASSHVAAASHPRRLTLSSVLASVSQHRTKCLAWRRANRPSLVRDSAGTVSTPPPLHVVKVCVGVGEINVPR